MKWVLVAFVLAAALPLVAGCYQALLASLAGLIALFCWQRISA